MREVEVTPEARLPIEREALCQTGIDELVAQHSRRGRGPNEQEAKRCRDDDDQAQQGNDRDASVRRRTWTPGSRGDRPHAEHEGEDDPGDERAVRRDPEELLAQVVRELRPGADDEGHSSDDERDDDGKL